MLSNREYIFPTFVLACVLFFSSIGLGAKVAPSPDIDETEPIQTHDQSFDTNMRDTVNIAVPPPTKQAIVTQREYFYPYRQAIALRTGLAFGSGDGSGAKIGGVQYQFVNSTFLIFEAGADLATDGTGSLSFARRWIYSRSRFRPYTKAGGGILVKPSDGLAFFVNYSNYRIDGAAGAEYSIRKSQSLRAELETAVSLKAFLVMATVGYVWAW